METYPIVIDGELTGKLTVDRQGARTVFDAESRMLPGVVRLSVYGDGKEGYLGVLAPEGDKLRLRKSLSRSQLRDFPGEIGTVERSGLDLSGETPEPRQPPQGSAHGDDPSRERETETAAPVKPAETAPSPPRREPDPQPEGDAPGPGAHEALPEGTAQDLTWYASPDGALVCFDGARMLLALPPEDSRVPADPPGERREIEGREYLVFPTKNGRILRV